MMDQVGIELTEKVLPTNSLQFEAFHFNVQSVNVTAVETFSSNRYRMTTMYVKETGTVPH